MCSLQRTHGFGVRPAAYSATKWSTTCSLNCVFEVHHVVADAELPRHAARVVDILDAAALLVALELVRALFRPEPHRHADDVVALLMQQRGRHGAIHSAGHADDNRCRGSSSGTILSMRARPSRRPWETLLESESLAHRAVDILSEHQALDIALLDISKTATFTDYFVIATAQSPLQFSALVELPGKGAEAGAARTSATRRLTPDSGWMLLDFGDIIVHIFSPEQRAFYRLEELWGRTAPVVRFTG